MTQPNWKIWDKYREKFGLLDTAQTKADWEAYQDIEEEEHRANKKRDKYRKSSKHGKP